MITKTIGDFINLIFDLCDKNILFNNRNLFKKENTSIKIDITKNGKVNWIWLHSDDKFTAQSHRVAYEKIGLTDNYRMAHYMWIDKKGWTLVGELNTKIATTYKPILF